MPNTSPQLQIIIRLIFHLFLVFLSIIIAFVLLQSKTMHNFLDQAKSFTLIGSFISGILFTSTFTAAPATASLFILGENHNPLIISLIAAMGAVVGDLVISRFIRKELSNNLYTYIIPKKTRILKNILHTKVVYWFIATVAIIIIASPLPDELGISLLSLIHFRTHHFILMSFTVNFLGILLITSIARIR